MQLFKKKNTFILKRKINEEYEYISGVENIKEFSYKTYSDALKKFKYYLQIN